MQTYVLRLWLPDIPGTLGRVAAAIGQANGDVIGIEILERGAGMAIDELIVTLPIDDAAKDSALRLDELIAHVSLVEGVAIEDVQAGVLTRGVIARLIQEHPAIGAKLLVKLTQLLAQRLRNTSNQLVKLLQQQGATPPS